MHIPDGFISPKMYVPAYAVATPLWVFAMRRLKRKVDVRAIPLLAALTALCLVLMSIAVPLPGGTSTHAAGTAVIALLFGVWAGYMAISLVLTIQAFLFGIGGITSLPINALSLGLAGTASALLVFRVLRRSNEKIALFAAGWIGVNIPAILVAFSLGVQPLIAHAQEGSPLFFPFGLRITVPAVVLPHLLVGIGEGALTIFVYRLVKRLAPERWV